MENTRLYAIVDWEDGASGVVCLSSIVRPRMDFHQYEEGQLVTARFGRETFECKIIRIGENKKALESDLDHMIKSKSVSEGIPGSKGTCKSKSGSTSSATGLVGANKSKHRGKSGPRSLASDKPAKVVPQKKKPASSPSDEAALKESERKRNHVLNALQQFSQRETTPDHQQAHPSVGLKAPKAKFVNADCVKCALLEEKVESLTEEGEQKEEKIGKLQRQIVHLQAQLKEQSHDSAEQGGKKMLDAGNVAAGCSNPTGNIVAGCSKVEIIPGSGLFVFPSAFEENKRKSTSTAKARHMLNCLLTSDEIIEMGSVKKVGKHLINTIALFASNDDVGNYARCKAALRSKITATICLNNKSVKNNTSTYKSPEYIEDSDSDSE